ncbi:LTA synthase family protein [Robertkochia solimangrovi]|uniref:LTA synthase family protein n=1 Tax=Robertkochia solimangrovi TaxID=2213046 RepID=UPI00117E3D05|nr:alkaline phosphatase family protein [Robertkochia solimangrovi]TRZ43622.1 LTA synthase family protein [Robertkochia solimangrovi]
MKSKPTGKRYSLLVHYLFFFLIISAVFRLLLLILDFEDTDHGIIDILHSLITGTFFDIGVISFFLLPVTLYLFLLPSRWIGSVFDKIIIIGGTVLMTVILTFSFFAEFVFWEEFSRRFNFIAVDYLIYTYEVVRNIDESYPIPVLVSAVLLLAGGLQYYFKRRRYYDQTFTHSTPRSLRGLFLCINISMVLFFSFKVDNEMAEWSPNRYNNEISKAGIYSFFAAFRNNELSYPEFYETIPDEKAFEEVRAQLTQQNVAFSNDSKTSIYRMITDTVPESHPNVMLICVESLSGSFLGSFGNPENLTPNLDTLSERGISFTDLYATGTRTVRGMEALTLCIPPTPGRSIVKREQNEHLFTIGSVFRDQGYNNTFFYGGDGYFDNMNHYFSSNGFDIVDRGRKLNVGDEIMTHRENITDTEVSFENAWGVCDEDLFGKVLKYSDSLSEKANKPFFNFIMTTSNHRPYTYPEGRIDIASGTGRKGAVKYTDYAIGNMIRSARKHSWFKNTVFIIVADHCASSAGRWDLDVANYRIPAIIYNLPGHENPEKITKVCSQIDLLPTLFGMLHWTYESDFYGRDILTANSLERALIGNYRKLGLLENDRLVVLGDEGSSDFYLWNPASNTLTPDQADIALKNKAISYYQSAYYLFHHQGLNDKNDEDEGLVHN